MRLCCIVLGVACIALSRRICAKKAPSQLGGGHHHECMTHKSMLLFFALQENGGWEGERGKDEDFSWCPLIVIISLLPFNSPASSPARTDTLWRNSSSHVSGFKYVSSSGSGFWSISRSVRRSPFTGEVNLCKCCILLFNFVYFTIPFSAVSARHGALGQQVVQQLLAVFSQSIKL